ncbi:transmembrane protein 205 [Lates japonicus]|uniref:Transmembrane protein 205 n=1 Tax=Lates japonicus TaxID=270547 RepID=A0AAD3N9N9_LATJO|nr:transmembrane protein 205 [Lates japonicus]
MKSAALLRSERPVVWAYATEVMFQMREVEKEHGLGTRSACVKRGIRLPKEQDPGTELSIKAYRMLHGLSNLCKS